MADLPDQKPSRLGRIVGAAFLFGIVVAAFAVPVAIFHPDSPLPDAWNPTKPLRVSDPVTSLTSWKLLRATRSTESCLAALEDADVTSRPFTETSEHCSIASRVDVARVGQATVAPVETACATALRLAMWERHGLQPAAQEILGSTITRIDHIGSYNCRQMRTGSGESGRWSTHATANAIDIAGFQFADGTRLRLIDDWSRNDAGAAFLRRARDTSCDWFRVTLSPDYNRLHADHFHLQATGWGLCR